MKRALAAAMILANALPALAGNDNKKPAKPAKPAPWSWLDPYKNPPPGVIPPPRFALESARNKSKTSKP